MKPTAADYDRAELILFKMVKNSKREPGVARAAQALADEIAKMRAAEKTQK